jgi:hypothetical protein
MAVDRFDADFYLFVDKTNIKPETEHWAAEIAGECQFKGLEYHSAGSSAASFRHVAQFALSQFKNQPVYFLEDDYLHTPHAHDILMEGLELADYVSLYDHLDKYIPASRGGNPLIDDDGGEVTKVFRSMSAHWKLTNSTTMTFATNIETLRSDWNIWKPLIEGTYPHDMQIFLNLRQAGRSLVTPIPGASTHCMPEWASPGIDWQHIVNGFKVEHGVYL